ncbi:hypothetical protein AMS68_006704 [Peltaster fructicola]|uniref:O-methyltransferase domain-containing protein n=1 Tax=Peltaster fructicola TaxID=286661 RepID=A0A6H0Y2F6_9PEZI|nr:hypothetical protein AMS68_006704 [Peltaster fructicola]
MTAPSFKGREYEKDRRWTDVDRYAVKHLDQNNQYKDALQYAKDLAEQEGLPNIEVSTLQGRFLASQCQLINAKHILEVGTLGGYSAIWLASTSHDVKVTTIEIDPKHKAVAERVLEHAGLLHRVEILLGNGVDVLQRLRAEVVTGARPRYDLVFIDADKPNNLNYFNRAVLISRSRACIIVDNVVRKGNLANEAIAQTDERVRGSREVVEAVGQHAGVLQSTLIQTVGEKNYDGFLLVVLG